MKHIFCNISFENIKKNQIASWGETGTGVLPCFQCFSTLMLNRSKSILHIFTNLTDLENSDKNPSIYFIPNLLRLSYVDLRPPQNGIFFEKCLVVKSLLFKRPITESLKAKKLWKIYHNMQNWVLLLPNFHLWS